MPATKSLSTIIAAATSVVAATPTVGTVVNLTTAYGAEVTIKITNGATAPTVAAAAYVEISGDGTTFKLLQRIGGDLVANSVNEFAVEIPAPAMYVRVTIKDNTVQNVTAEAFAQVLTGL